MLSPAQLAQRLEGITATDAAAIAGVHPHRSPLDVFLDKCGLADPAVPAAGLESTRSRWGDLLEKPIRDDYEQRHGVRVEVPGTLRHEKQRWQMATPDGLVYPIGAQLPERGLEIKVHGREAILFGGLEYGAPGTDEVPPHELVQCMWGIRVTGLHLWDLIAFLDGAPNEYVIERDDELIGMLVETCERFRVDHIERREPPPPDGSKSWNAWLKRRWKKNTDDLVSIDSEPELRALVDQLKDLRETAAATKDQIETIVQSLKAAIGSNAGLSWREFGRKNPSAITWKFNRPSIETDHEALANDVRTTAKRLISEGTLDRAVGRIEPADPKLAEELQQLYEALRFIASEQIVLKHTKETPGARPFVCPRHWKKSKTDDNKKGKEQ